MIPHLLTLLVAVPLLGALAVLFSPRQAPRFLRLFSLGVTLATFGLSLYLVPGSAREAGFRLVEKVSWIPSLGISYHVGVDGISLWLVILTTVTTPIALLASWESIQSRIKEYVFSFLLLESAMIGTFLALDLFVFYVFWELMLIPMYLIIGVWGGPKRVNAAIKFFLFTMFGSVLMLVAILVLTNAYGDVAGKARARYVNRRVRNRTHGGVGAGAGNRPGYPNAFFGRLHAVRREQEPPHRLLHGLRPGLAGERHHHRDRRRRRHHLGRWIPLFVRRGGFGSRGHDPRLTPRPADGASLLFGRALDDPTATAIGVAASFDGETKFRRLVENPLLPAGRDERAPAPLEWGRRDPASLPADERHRPRGHRRRRRPSEIRFARALTAAPGGTS